MIKRNKPITSESTIKTFNFTSLTTPDADVSKNFNTLMNDKISATYIVEASPKRMLNIIPIDCFALQLAHFILSTVKTAIFPFNENGSFTESFYNHCMEKIEDKEIGQETEDKELLLIYMKQMIALLQKCEIIHNDNGVARVADKSTKDHILYPKLFQAFWNDIDWSDIFPSDEVLAEELKKNRYILLDLILKHQNSAEISDISNDFFDLTGFTNKNDLFTISFLDFYLFTWMKHFGIISYSNVNYLSPVKISVTEKGRKFIKCIL